jgi:hypothetical protein
MIHSVELLWQEGLIVAPSINSARGVITFFSDSLFDKIIFKSGTADGRSTWIIGDYNRQTELFVSINSPNSGKNAEFYTAFFTKVNNLVTNYTGDNIYISGNFNLVLEGGIMAGRKQSKYEQKLANLVDLELKALGLRSLVEAGIHTWNDNSKYSTLDYIYGPRAVADSSPDSKAIWGLDKSDHCAIQTTI